MKNFITNSIISIGISFIIIMFVGQIYIFKESSMIPTFHNNDIAIVEKITKFWDLDREDIIVFRHEDKDLVKRIIGTPGDTIQIVNGIIYINNEIYEDTYKKEDFLYAGIAKSEITLKENEYFVLGDNRNYSMDSRDIGVINKKSIIGKVLFH